VARFRTGSHTRVICHADVYIIRKDGFEGNSNPDNEPTHKKSQNQIWRLHPVFPFRSYFHPAPTISEDEYFRIDEVPQEKNSSDSESDDLPIFEM
jgi:hypothetical protein